MKKVLKLVLFCSLLLYSFVVSAQTTLEQYLNAESNRIAQAQTTEVSIQNYINANFATYNLSQSDIDKIVADAQSEGNSAQTDIDTAASNLKRARLRESYFNQNAAKVADYRAILPTQELMQTCINGDFESTAAPTANYTFNSSRTLVMNACATPAFVAPATATVNDFTSNVSVMSRVQPNYVAFDQSLNTPARGNIMVPTISPNGGNQSMKLNVNDGNYDVTTMSRTLVVTGSSLDYEFSLLLQDGGTDHTAAEKPFFRVNIILNGLVVFTKCINAIPACYFNQSHIPNDNVANDIYYTGWVCDDIDVSQYLNQQITVEFAIGDCSLGGHFGTVYIDNVCNFSCNSPIFGLLKINQPDNNCNTVNPGPYQVCGNFTLPLNSTFNSISIAVSKNGAAAQTINNPVVQINGTNYCFFLNPAIFGTINNGDTYRFDVMATYLQNCGPLTSTISNNASATVLFSNCCPPTLTSAVTINTNVHQQRSDWIISTDRITFGNGVQGDGVIYHAGNYIELNPNFEAVLGSQFSAYPQSCSGAYTYRSNNTNPATFTAVLPDSISNGEEVIVYPNPSHDLVNIILRKNSFKQVTIISIDGKTLIEKNINGTKNLQVDIGRLNSGVYIIDIITSGGQKFSKKLIKQ